MTKSVSRPIRHAAIAILLVYGASLAARPSTVAASGVRDQTVVPSLPDRLSDAEFWSLVSDISEPGGFFRITDNFTSNEPEVGRVFTMLRQKGIGGCVSPGVGPEQNLSYIAAIPPARAF